jgi:hypothetical protein
MSDKAKIEAFYLARWSLDLIIRRLKSNVEQLRAAPIDRATLDRATLDRATLEQMRTDALSALDAIKAMESLQSAIADK